MREVIIDGVRYVPAISKPAASESVASYLTTQRKRVGLKQNGAAAALGIEPGRMHRIEAAWYYPSLPECVRICEYYGITLDDLAARVASGDIPRPAGEKA